MVASFRKSLAWLRGRWHADLEFQHGAQREALLERLDVVLATLAGQGTRLEKLNERLAMVESQTAAANAEQVARTDDTHSLIRATSQELIAVMHAAAGEVSGTSSTAQEETRQPFSAVSQEIAQQLQAIAGAEPRTLEAISQLGQALREFESRVQERVVASVTQTAELSTPLNCVGQNLQQSALSLAALTDEFREECRRNAERTLRLEQSLERQFAAGREQAEQTRREEAAAAAQRSRLTADDLSAVERQGVFVVGSARSGTTILSDCLNVSRDIYMLQEACFFCSDLAAKYVGWEKYDFAQNFNERHISYGNRREKGTYVPTSDTPDRSPLEFMNRMRPKYRYVGEKVAFGPEPHYMGDNWEADFLAYHARYFYHSHYFITVRAPHEALWSMHKMFPDRPIAGLFEAWLRTLRTVLDLYLAFPNTYFFVLEWLDEALIGKIADILQTEIPLPDEMLGRHYQLSALGRNETVPVLQPYRAWLAECAAIYRDVREAFSRDTLQVAAAAHERVFVTRTCKQIDALLDDVMRALRTRTLATRRAA
jgi:hypothetical protein